MRRGHTHRLKSSDGTADAIAACIPRAERQIIEGQTHAVDTDPKALAPVLEQFFSG
jgi:hypothetical protein